MFNGGSTISLIWLLGLLAAIAVDAKGGGGGRGGGGGGGRGGGGRTSGGSVGGGRGSYGGGGGGKLGSSGAVRGAVTGFAAGYVGGSIGSSIGHSIGGYGGYYGGTYYWMGTRYYPGTTSGKIQCEVETPSDFPVTYNDTNERVKELIYECPASQYCCDDVCCSEGLSTGGIIGIVFGCILLIVGCISLRGFIKRARKAKAKREQRAAAEAAAGSPESVESPKPLEHYIGPVGPTSTQYVPPPQNPYYATTADHQIGNAMGGGGPPPAYPAPEFQSTKPVYAGAPPPYPVQ